MIAAVADFCWDDVVVGADLEAVKFAYDNGFNYIKNRLPHHHSYEGREEDWAWMSYEIYVRGQAPFLDKVTAIHVLENNHLKVVTSLNTFYIKYENLHVFDDTNVVGYSLNREIDHYRVIDWFDCQGLYDIENLLMSTGEKFVSNIQFFLSKRIDGNQKYYDLLCESFLTEEQLKNFDYSDTMVRFKLEDILKGDLGAPTLTFWKRDIYPVYKTI